MKHFDLFHTYCHHCRTLAHCWPVTWKGQRPRWQVLLLCAACKRRRAMAV
jgi:hypothetical protein